MTNKNNFRWLEEDIDNTLVLKVVRKIDGNTSFYGVFNVMDVLETTGDELDIETANIDDLTNLLTLGIVRFVNVIDRTDVLDIPFRNLFKIYVDANVLGRKKTGREIPLKEIEAFYVINGSTEYEYMIVPSVVNEVNEDLLSVMKTASEFGKYGMQQKFDALSNVNLINHRRIIRDNRSRGK